MKLGRYFCSEHAAALFPDDVLLGELGIESYMGITLYDSEGEAAGIMAVMSRSPMDRPSARVQSFLQIFAGRAAAELTRLRSEERIRALNTDLENRVAKRTSELKTAQEQLVEFETMKALATLVSGVAHEINTPIGIGVTAASHLNDKVALTRSKYESGSMKRSDFETFLGDAAETSSMILSNLGVASRLIQGFKGVAVDQSDEARRVVVVKDYLEEVLLSLRPRLKRTRIDVRLECPGHLQLDSFPGSLSQAVTNLVMNSLIHAFEEDEKGSISIEVEERGEDIRITYFDDGAGMTEEVVEKIYEPFFTTRRGRGGSGLGMHVVYTAVTEALGGTLTCESSPGEGSVFVMTFPRERRSDDD
jgi:signal transduction histidine kinase